MAVRMHFQVVERPLLGRIVAMVDRPQIAESPKGWKAIHVLVLASICLALGLSLGYILRDSRPLERARERTPSQNVTSANQPSAGGSMPSLDDMQRMAEKQAEPLFDQLKKDPANAGLWNRIGTIYKSAHQFKAAAGYYQKSLDLDPKNVAARTDMASCLYYQGDVDGALDQLRQSLQYAPNDVNSLFNLGLIRWQAKKDASGAQAAWQQLLRANPKLPAAQRAEVERLISAVQHPAGKQVTNQAVNGSEKE